MADKSRIVNTKFWTDSYVEQLNPTEKLLFLYCLTSPQSNLLGIYEVSESRIRFETRIPLETIRKGFERFAKDKKIYYYHGFIIIPTFLSHQKLNSNMKIGVTKLIDDLPEWLKQELFGDVSQGLSNDLKSFEKLRNTLFELEIEAGSEGENKDPSPRTDEVKKIIEYLNQRANKKFTTKNKENNSHIKARLSEGFIVNDFKKVVDVKTEQWANTDMDKFLRPTTLFSPSKFESYLNERPKRKEEKNEPQTQRIAFDKDGIPKKPNK